jgi:Domain of unknown function (DUF5134)
MVALLAARWLLTAVFAAAGLAAALPRSKAATARPAGWAFCGAMCAALIAMMWWSEPAVAAWLQAAVFGCAGMWSVLTHRRGFGPIRPPGPAGLHHALMAGAMIWMLTAMPGAAGMPAPRHDHDAMAGMPQAGVPGPVLAVSILAAGYCAAASIPWLRRAIGPGPRLTDPAAAGQAAMSAGMAALLVAML